MVWGNLTGLKFMIKLLSKVQHWEQRSRGSGKKIIKQVENWSSLNTTNKAQDLCEHIFRLNLSQTQVMEVVDFYQQWSIRR